MREIKFRAWGNKEKKWLLGYEYPNLGGFSMFGETVLLGEYSSELDKFLFSREGRKREDFILMQFTGLKDKNGKEIYEEDVLRKKTRVRRKATEEIGTVIWDDKVLGFNLYRGETYVGLLTWVDDVEVIGNIYENPELLS
jgi:uncharacterized phage protein (TIGR01671 family)